MADEPKPVRVFIAKRCNLNIDGKIFTLEPGRHHMIPAGLAESDYVLAHTDDPPEFEPKHGTPEYAAFHRRKEERRILLEDAISAEAAERMRSTRRVR